MYTQGMVLRICFAAGLLYIGLLMLIDPDRFLGLTDQVACGLRNFQHAWQRLPWRESAAERVRRGPGVRAGVRSAGLVLCVLAFVQAAAIV
jgi:hypothetical protein